MEGIALLLTLLVLALLISLVLPWIHQGRLARLERQVKLLNSELDAVLTILEKERPDIASARAAARRDVLLPPVSPYPAAAKPTPPTAAAPQAAPVAEAASASEPAPEPAAKAAFVPQIAPSAEPRARWRDSINFERQFGALLPVWIGGIALAFAGFFLVKYSIEKGLLSDTVRVVLGVAFGLGLLWAGNWVRSKPGFANGQRIAQALTGAGIADLYVSIFAATTLYHLLPPTLGFGGMAVVTAAAVVLSLRHGAPIALLGLVGGMVTPALIHSGNPQAGPLFVYLYFVTAGVMLAVRREHWWLMAIPTVVGAFLWVTVWLTTYCTDPADAFWLGMFLIAIKFTVVTISNQQYAADAGGVRSLRKPSVILNVLTMGGASLLMGLVAAQHGFGAMSWTLFGLLAAGSIGLAFFNPRLYGSAPWFSLTVNAVMFIAWNGAPQEYAITIVLFGALYAASGYALQLRSGNPLNWSLLAITAAIGYYLIAYFHLRHTGLFANVPLFWGALALVLAVLATMAVQRVLAHTPSGHPLKQHLLAAYAGAGTAFVSLALTVELEKDFLALAFAGQTLAMSWINTKVQIGALRYIVAALAGVFVYLMAPDGGMAIEYSGPGFDGATLAAELPLALNPLLYLGLPGLLIGGSTFLLRRREDTPLVWTLECIAIALLSFTVYVLLRQLFHPVGEILTGQTSFIERGLATNVVILLGMGCLWAGDRLTRRALTWSGLTMLGIGAARIVLLDYLWGNPLWSAEYVGAAPVANALLLAYGLPALWLGELVRRLPAADADRWRKAGLGAILVLAFTLVTLNVRQLFHGAYLNGAELSNMEVYSYSIAWLAFGVALLFYGVLRGDRLLRFASLAIMILTAGKVFLYDARELEGLYRVFSFLGLGVCLIGLSWFYTRFVFGTEEAPAEAEKAPE